MCATNGIFLYALAIARHAGARRECRCASHAKSCCKHHRAIPDLAANAIVHAAANAMKELAVNAATLDVCKSSPRTL
jgi:hypothetical protein